MVTEVALNYLLANFMVTEVALNYLLANLLFYLLMGIKQLFLSYLLYKLNYFWLYYLIISVLFLSK